MLGSYLSIIEGPGLYQFRIVESMIPSLLLALPSNRGEKVLLIIQPFRLQVAGSSSIFIVRDIKMFIIMNGSCP